MRVCPVCQPPAVKHSSSHLSMVHGLNGHERTPHLKNAVLYSTTTPSPVQPLRTKAEKAKTKKNIHPRQKREVAQHLRQASGKEPTTDIKPEPYPSFRFRHKFSLMIVGPSMSGKSYFVKELLEKDHVYYEEPHKCRKIHWFYGQYQDMFKDLKKSLGHEIYFREGLPTFQLNLSDIDPKYNNIIVLDDLMDLAVDSQIISKLFTQGRHRNASVILLLQNAFPKGKHNRSISRNAQYMSLFRCPADRRQIGIMAERIFNKQKSLFMSIYNDVTIKPYSYVLVDNKADTSVCRQIVSDVFGSCVSYTLPGLLGSMTIEPQSAGSMNPNDDDVQSFPDQKLHGNRSTTRIETQASESMNAKQSAVKCSTARILQINDRPGPLLVHLNQIQWSMVNEAFRELRCGGNLPPGWEIWRIYLIKANGY